MTTSIERANFIYYERIKNIVNRISDVRIFRKSTIYRKATKTSIPGGTKYLPPPPVA